jgi:hypothetical protein
MSKSELTLILNESISEVVIASRESWESEFDKMHQNEDDRLIVPDVFEEDIMED